MWQKEWNHIKPIFIIFRLWDVFLSLEIFNITSVKWSWHLKMVQRRPACLWRGLRSCRWSRLWTGRGCTSSAEESISHRPLFSSLTCLWQMPVSCFSRWACERRKARRKQRSFDLPDSSIEPRDQIQSVSTEAGGWARSHWVSPWQARTGRTRPAAARWWPTTLPDHSAFRWYFTWVLIAF